MAPVNKKSKKSVDFKTRQMLEALKNVKSSSESSGSDNETIVKKPQVDKKNRKVLENLTNSQTPKSEMPSTSKSVQKQEVSSTSSSAKKPPVPRNELANRKREPVSSSDEDEGFYLEQLLQKNWEGSQLFGEDYENGMVNIGDGIYCRPNNFSMALGTSRHASHVARKLMDGVFTKETLLRSTFTGLPARAQGKQRQNVKVVALDLKARNAIINFAQKYAAKKDFTEQNISFIERSMSQHIGEIKREEEERQKNREQ